MRSSTRSITIVAIVAVTLRPSCRASRYGRRMSPARAGSSPRAANPISSRERRCGTASGRSGAAGIASATARITERQRPRTRSASTSRSRRARAHLHPHVAEVRVAQEPREQGNRQNRDDDRTYAQRTCAACGTRNTIYQALSATVPVLVAYGCGRVGGPCKIASQLSGCPARGTAACRSRRPLLETRLNGLAPHRQGKVRDIYDLGDALLLVATDRISAFDYVLGSGIPDKGKVLTQLSTFWFEQDRAHRAEPRARRQTCGRIRPRCGRMPTCSQAARCWCARRSRCRSSASRAATCRARAGRTTVATGAVCGVALPAGCASPTGCPSRSSRPPPRPRAATT